MPIHFREPAVLATDPKLTTRGDKQVCELFVYIEGLERTPQGRKDKAIPFEVWGNPGRAAHQQLGKGSVVILSGELVCNSYTNGDGQPRSRWVASGDVKFVRIKRNGQYVDPPTADVTDDGRSEGIES